MTSETMTYSTSKTLTKNSFSRTGYTFTGWNTKANGIGISYSDGAFVKNLSFTSGATVLPSMPSGRSTAAL
jgi:uncharacterized repeat protein (TIGR02543 family)